MTWRVCNSKNWLTKKRIWALSIKGSPVTKAHWGSLKIVEAQKACQSYRASLKWSTRKNVGAHWGLKVLTGVKKGPSLGEQIKIQQSFTQVHTSSFNLYLRAQCSLHLFYEGFFTDLEYFDEWQLFSRIYIFNKRPLTSIDFDDRSRRLHFNEANFS